MMDIQTYQALLDALGAPVWVLQGNQIHFANTSAQRLTGYTADEMQAMVFSDLIPNDSHEFLPDWAEPTTLPALIFPLVTRHSAPVWVELIINNWHTTGQDFWVITATDVTQFYEHHPIEDALRESEARFKNAFEWSPIGMSLTGVDGRWLKVNRSLIEMLGYTESELFATDFSQLTYSEDIPRNLVLFEAALRGEIDQYQMEKRYIHKDGHLIHSILRSALLRDENGQPLYFVSQIEDITQRKQMAEALLNHQKLSIALEKERELHDMKTTMMIRISHEFRTPLAVIGTSSDMLDRYADRLTPEQRQQRIQQIRKQVRHIAGMLDDIMLVLQGILSQNSLKRQPFNLAHLAQTTLQSFQAQYPEQAPHLQLDGDLTHVNADEELIRRILYDLLDNALKYAPPQTPIHVKITRQPEQFTLEVQDTGNALEKVDEPRLFEAFYRGRNAGETPGLGLGLTIVKHAVELHRGEITVACMPDTGTIFKVVIPLVD